MLLSSIYVLPVCINTSLPLQQPALMASSFSKTLIRTPAAYLFSAAKQTATRRLSTLPERSSSFIELTASEAEAKMVDKIEDAIHGIIVIRSKPDWLPFVPGSSYWAPPRRASYGVADVVNKIANALTEEEYLSLTSLQGWPSSAYYIHDGASSQIDYAGSKISSANISVHEEEEYTS